MSDSDQTSAGGLQFDRAEFATPQVLACVACKRPIVADYFTANGQPVCEACRRRLGTGQRPVTLANVAKGALFGLGAAVVSGVLWGLVIQAVKFNLGLFAVVVGVFVGRAVAKGGARTGGWIFQALAMGLTYFAIALSSLAPIVAALNQSGRIQDVLSPAAIISVGVYMIESPVLHGTKSIMGLVLYAIALYQAWKANQAPQIVFTGPLHVTPPPVAAMAATVLDEALPVE